MDSIKKLEWISRVKDNKEWITVIPSSGYGDFEDVVIVVDGKRRDDDDDEGYVYFKCKLSDGNDSDEKEIKVCRNFNNAPPIIIIDDDDNDDVITQNENTGRRSLRKSIQPHYECNCYTNIKSIIDDEYFINNTNCNTVNSINIVPDDVESCGNIKIFLLCENCNCSDTPDNEDSFCIYDVNEEYPEEYKYVGDMPKYGKNGLTIDFLEPYKENGNRATKFIAFWVDDNGELIKIDESGEKSNDGKYCGKEFTVYETYNFSCDCILDNYKILTDDNFEILLPFKYRKYRLANDTVSEIFSYKIDKKYKDCVKIQYEFDDEDGVFYDETIAENDDSYTIIVTGKYTIKDEEETKKTISFNVSVINKTNNEQIESNEYSIVVQK